MPNLPCLRLARRAAEEGGSVAAVLNASNEVAVDAFLQGRIAFTDIPSVIEVTMNTVQNGDISNIENVLNIDNEAREVAAAQLDLFR
jgi:1-deoxy-D-xylulose-5-phosphate reductoisomerase